MAELAVYKICAAEEWRAAAARGVYAGSADDKRDGYIHLSKASQLAGVLGRFFVGRSGLIVVALPAAALPLRWEGEPDNLYPHLYGVLPTEAAIAVHDLPDDDNARAALLRSLA